ncbi:MAG: DUF1501 domain-containing protein [Pirellulaceae bacterium]|nr:DUF1501 domain-containing protein [Pirellulaceae bacterium]
MNWQLPQAYSRRQLLQQVSSGFGMLAFASLATWASGNTTSGTGGPLAPQAPHFPARAKRVIFLCMRGGPSHVDTFDYKPEMSKLDGQSGKFRGTLMKSPWDFRQHRCGLWITELLPKLSEQADQLCLLRGMHTDQPVHPSAMTQLHTGSAQFVRPSLGAWTLYGLGSENDSLPGFVCINPAAGSGGNYGSAFLPAIYQGTSLGKATGPLGSARSSQNAERVADIQNPRLTARMQRQQLDLIQQLNRQKLKADVQNPGVDGIIESYELAFRMQSALPDLMDISGEDAKTLALYGVGQQPTDKFGRQCLMARRFVEAGVRFVELEHTGWDTHQNLSNRIPELCGQIDQPIAGLLTDLKRRGLLKDTLVIWAGEFGRTPYAQNGNGRDHNNKGFTTWMAGGGVRGGFSYGATDETGAEAVEGRCHIHDWHATILHLLGLDHQKLTYRYAGRDFRLTDVSGNVLTDIVA